MKYFITGGCGFIGANYVDHLLNTVSGVSKVTVYDKFTYAANPKNLQNHKTDSRLEIITGDICDYELLEKSMKNHDFVIHFAAESHVDRSIISSTAFVQTNLFGTYNVLESCRINKVETLVHVSTDEVYGSLSEGSADENQLLAPNSPYAASKAGSDLLARSYFMTHGIDIRITRCSNNYGKYQFPEKVIPVFINTLLQDQKVPIYGTGSNIREWIHVSDHCKGLQTVLEHGSPGEIYNIGSGIYLTNLELANKIIKILNKKSDLIEFVKDRKGHDFRYSVNFDKISKLGFSPQVNFDDGLESTIAWYQSNQFWWKQNVE
jgi:dTDP-glucose 4,6-dehydratase